MEIHLALGINFGHTPKQQSWKWISPAIVAILPAKVGVESRKLKINKKEKPGVERLSSRSPFFELQCHNGLKSIRQWQRFVLVTGHLVCHQLPWQMLVTNNHSHQDLKKTLRVDMKMMVIISLPPLIKPRKHSGFASLHSVDYRRIIYYIYSYTIYIFIYHIHSFPSLRVL